MVAMRRPGDWRCVVTPFPRIDLRAAIDEKLRRRDGIRASRVVLGPGVVAIPNVHGRAKADQQLQRICPIASCGLEHRDG